MLGTDHLFIIAKAFFNLIICDNYHILEMYNLEKEKSPL